MNLPSIDALKNQSEHSTNGANDPLDRTQQPLKIRLTRPHWTHQTPLTVA